MYVRGSAGVDINAQGTASSDEKGTMRPSREAVEIGKLIQPTTVRPGDMYRQRCGVMLVLGHKKRGRKHPDGHTWIWLYHFADSPTKESLRVTPKDLRDHDANSTQAEAWIDSEKDRGEAIIYVGNLFDLLPLDMLGPRVSRDLL